MMATPGSSRGDFGKCPVHVNQHVKTLVIVYSVKKLANYSPICSMRGDSYSSFCL